MSDSATSDPRAGERGPAPRPLVALPADIREFQGYAWHATPDQYPAAAFDAAGVAPVVVPALGAALAESVLDAVDGLLVTGSRTNVHPARYGAEPLPAHEPFDPARDETSFALIRGAVERGLPVLAICRGIQEMNVAFGGTLAGEIQEREGIEDHRMVPSDDPDRRFAIRHDVTVEPGPLREALGGTVREAPGGAVRVNSLHRQAIDTVAEPLRVEARAPDGTIEAVSLPGARAWTVGVQWHPEYWARARAARRDAPSWALFEAFGRAVRAHRAGRLEGGASRSAPVQSSARSSALNRTALPT